MSIIWENYSYNDLTADIVPIAEPVQSLAVVTVEELECQVRERIYVTSPGPARWPMKAASIALALGADTSHRLALKSSANGTK